MRRASKPNRREMAVPPLGQLGDIQKRIDVARFVDFRIFFRANAKRDERRKLAQKNRRDSGGHGITTWTHNDISAFMKIIARPSAVQILRLLKAAGAAKGARDSLELRIPVGVSPQPPKADCQPAKSRTLSEWQRMNACA